jgi:hypothetical protein
MAETRMLRTSFEVVSGLIPGQPVAEWTRQWHLASDATPEEMQQAQDEAHAYARHLTDPSRLNWVQLTWIWY